MMSEKHLVRLLRALVCVTFLGRAWQHLRWDAPFRALLWKQAWLQPIVEGMLGISWRDWVSDPFFDTAIQTTIRGFGLLYLACAVAALTVTQKQRLVRGLLCVGAAALCFLGFLYFVEKGFRVGQWMEYGLQFSAPLFLLAGLDGRLRDGRTRLWCKAAVAATFIGHGLYAAGIYPMPGTFVTMLMNGTGLSENAARLTLVWAGYADFAAAALIFLPRAARPALAYMVVWGFATAAARLVAYADMAAPVAWLDGRLYQTLYRLVHGGLPLVLLLTATPVAAAAAAAEPSPAAPPQATLVPQT